MKFYRNAIVASVIVALVIVLFVINKPVLKYRPDPTTSLQEGKESSRVTINAGGRHDRPARPEIPEYQQLAKLSVDELKSRFKTAVFKNYTTEAERRSALGNLAAALAKSLGFRDSKAFINSAMGDGELYESLLHVITLHSNDQVDAILKDLDDTLSTAGRNWIVTALHIKSRQNNTADAHLPTIVKLVADDPATLRAITTLEMEILKDPEMQKQRLAELIGMSSGIPESDRINYLKALFKISNNYLALETWEAIENLPDSSEYQSHRQDAYLRMMDDDPAGTLARLSGSTSAANATLMGRGFEKWLKQSPAVAMKWLEENQHGLERTQSDGISMALASFSAANSKDANSIKDAWTQVESIQDPAIRKAAEGRVWEKEKQILHTAVQKDPANTLNTIISGTSGHQTYWIEEAMHTWIKSDSAQAEAWYQKNWNSLPPEKSQYVAAAYAKDALAKGDAGAATLWANLIQDPKVKARIQASIANAQIGANH